MNSIPSLAAADYGLGQNIIEAIKDSAVADNAFFKGLKGRHSDNFIYRIPEPEDLPAALAKLSKAKKAKSRLPIMAYSRQRGLSTLGADQAVNVQGINVFNEATLNHLQISVTWLELNYSIFSIATDRDTSEALMLAWHFYVSQISKKHHHVKMKVKIENEEVEPKAFITDPKTLFASDIKVPDEKVFGLRADMVMQVPCFYGKSVSAPEDVRVGFDIFDLSVASP